MAEFTIKTEDIGVKVPETRLLLVGRTGAGKSATGNSILGKHAFSTSLGLQSQTVRTECAERVTFGRRLVVVDTPGFFDTGKSNDYIMQELIKIFGFLSPGFHALIFVMSPDRFTRECVKTKDLFLKTFGAGVAKYTIILVTGLDRIESEGGTFQRFISNSNAEFKRFHKLCDGRILAFNNRATGEEMQHQISKLLDMVDAIQGQTGNKCFTNLHFQTMKMYRKTQRFFGKAKLNRARKSLFKRIARRYGVEQKYVWGPETPHRQTSKDDDKAVLTNSCADESESDEEFDRWKFDDVDVDTDDVADRAELRQDPSYFERIIRFFVRLFQPLRDALFKSDDDSVEAKQKHC